MTYKSYGFNPFCTGNGAAVSRLDTKSPDFLTYMRIDFSLDRSQIAQDPYSKFSFSLV